jgi:flavodoxin
MNSLVVYGSRHGNTHKAAEAIAFELGKHGVVQLVSAEDVRKMLPDELDLIVVGGPTEMHRITEPVAQFFDRIGTGELVGTAAAAFDTRLRWPAWLTGSAAAGIAQKLQQARANVIAPQASFFVSGKLPVLEPGEIERAAAWAASLAARLESIPVTGAAKPAKA